VDRAARPAGRGGALGVEALSASLRLPRGEGGAARAPDRGAARRLAPHAARAAGGSRAPAGLIEAGSVSPATSRGATTVASALALVLDLRDVCSHTAVARDGGVRAMESMVSDRDTTFTVSPSRVWPRLPL